MFAKHIIDNADGVAELLTLLGNGKRLAIIGYLLDSELTVGTIAEKVGLSQSALSQHLAKLRALGVVQTRRERQKIYYSCNSEEVRALFVALSGIFPVPSAATDPAPLDRVN